MANGHGGRRPGAGQPKTGARQKTAEVANRYSTDGGSTPLDVMLRTMREYESQADAATDPEKKLMLMTEASEHAAKCAPYMHPRLQAVEHRGNENQPLRVKVEIEFV